MSLFKKVAGMTPILKNICQNCFCTAHTPPLLIRFTLYLAPFSLSSVTTQKQSSGGVLLEKVSLEIFAKFTGKHLYQRLFYDKIPVSLL